MKLTFPRTVLPLILLALLVAPASVHAGSPIPSTPAGVKSVLYARPFLLEKPLVHRFRKEAPSVDAGYLLVLEVDPALVYPRQTDEPVLYVGNETARRINVGYRSGRVIAFVPAPRETKDGVTRVALDLTKARIWFGTPELPERVDAARIAFESELAADAGIKPQPRAQVEQAIAAAAGLGVAKFGDGAALYREAARLIKQYSPSEKDLADGWMVGSEE